MRNGAITLWLIFLKNTSRSDVMVNEIDTSRTQSLVVFQLSSTAYHRLSSLRKIENSRDRHDSEFPSVADGKSSCS